MTSPVVIIASSFSLVQFVIGRIVLGFGVGIAACVAPMCKRYGLF